MTEEKRLQWQREFDQWLRAQTEDQSYKFKCDCYDCSWREEDGYCKNNGICCG